jgi:hypothetical protein
MRKSHWSATWKAEPAATPLRAAISGFPHAPDGAVERAPFLDPFSGALGLEGLGLIEILAGGKRPITGAGDDHCPCLGIVVEVIEGSRQFLAHGGMPGVEDIGAVEGDEADIIAMLDDQEVVHPVPFVWSGVAWVFFRRVRKRSMACCGSPLAMASLW